MHPFLSKVFLRRAFQQPMSLEEVSRTDQRDVGVNPITYEVVVFEPFIHVVAGFGEPSPTRFVGIADLEGETVRAASTEEDLNADRG